MDGPCHFSLKRAGPLPPTLFLGRDSRQFDVPRKAWRGRLILVGGSGRGCSACASALVAARCRR
jgi:hypothetical protein